MGARQDPDGTRVGDKIRVRDGPHAGARGIVHEVDEGRLIVELASGDLLATPAADITNFSLAARRAWNTMPKRAGRPRLESPRKKMVSMRLDIEVWRRLSQAAEFGQIPSREEAVNQWLRERLDSLPGYDPGISSVSVNSDDLTTQLSSAGNSQERSE